MKAGETPVSFEDVTDVLVATIERMRDMRRLSGSQPISTHALVSVMLEQFRDLHAKKMNVDTVMAAGRAAAARAAREMPAPPTTPFQKDTPK